MKYHVQSSITINAPLKQVRDLVKDFNTWSKWSPWNIAEPDHKASIEGDAGKIGHRMSWDGKIIGSGIQRIEAHEDDSILYDLQFIKPFKSSAKTRFDFKQNDNSTVVTWHMDSSMPFFLFFMIPKMKAWIEMDYQRGLKMLKELIEKGEIKAKTINEGIKDFDGFSYIGIKKTSKMDDMGPDMSKCFDQLVKTLQSNNAQAKNWVAIYTKNNLKEKTFTYIAAISDENMQDAELGSEYVRGKIESSKMLEIKHHGSYNFLGNAWAMGMMYLRSIKKKQKKYPFEYYWNNPAQTKTEDLKTSVYFPVK